MNSVYLAIGNSLFVLFSETVLHFDWLLDPVGVLDLEQAADLDFVALVAGVVKAGLVVIPRPVMVEWFALEVTLLEWHWDQMWTSG